MKINGIDPGLKGAVAQYDVIKDELIIIDNQFDGQKFVDRIFYKKFMDLPYADVSILENVKLNGGYDTSAKTGWSAAANATMQRGLGALGSMATQKSGSVVLVSPVTWKSQLFLTGNKQLSMDIAHLRFPRHKDKIKRHDHAEACLLISWHLHGDDFEEEV